MGINVDNARPFTGLMDELYLFKRALSKAELDEVSQLPRQLKAYAPDPPDGTKNLTTPLFKWSVGETAVLHNVYIGASPDLGPTDLVANHLAVALYRHVPGFEAGRTYYWRVDEVEADGVTIHAGDVLYKGDVWSFSTIGPGAGIKAQYFRGTELAGAPALTKVEDSVNHAWGSGEVAPGLSDNVSARWTANLEAPFTEAFQLITTSDDEGNRIYQSWTVNGVGTLTLAVRGLAANTPDQLYVAIEDKAGKIAVVMNPDSTLLTKTQWTEWKIPLANFAGVDATAVKKMYIDDIRVVK